MDLIRWSPRRDIVSLRNAMNRMWEDFFGRTERESSGAAWSPDIDIVETRDHYVVAVEAPGMAKEGIKITFRDNVLVIKGEKKQEEVPEGVNFHRCERCWGAFQRTFTIPSPVQVDKVSAVYKDGVLKVTVPKAEEAKAKQIPVVVK
jgi:HSP20 family protein